MTLVFMLIGAIIVYSLLQRFYRKNWHKGLEADIRFAVGHAVAGDTIDFVEVVTNRKRLPLPYVHLKFQMDRALVFEDSGDNAQISDKVYRNDIFSLLMYQRVTRKIPVHCTKRGVYSVNGMEIVSSGMFMDEVMVLRTGANTELIVYPKAVDTHMLNVAFTKIMGTIEKNKMLYEDPFVFRGIRDYTPMDTMNRINWKASARTGDLMVNQFNETICQEVCILLDVETEGMLKRDELSEISISIAAGLSQMLIENGVAVSMICNGLDYVSEECVITESASGLAHTKTINTALARINLNAEPVDYKWLIANHPELAQDYDNDGKKYAGKEPKLYVMIAQNKRVDLQEAFDRLTGGDSNCLWIIPATKEDSTELTHCNAQRVVWEVK
ncbi:MAG: DUF58 domain-containing protein [Lachnospira sp.]|nr:DUF58 domain-containing protein [Lachnospira sp.]